MSNNISEPNPTIVVGLGGTGQWVVCHVLKELMELYGLQKPEQLSQKVQILSIDTDFKNVATVGIASGTPSSAQIGKVKLSNQMIIPIGGDANEYAKRIAQSKDDVKSIGGWFDANWFLSQPGAEALLKLSSGAGAFRPLGRIAIPYNLTQEPVPTLRKAIENAINNINATKRLSAEDHLTVLVTGSLCGGTGAGMFVDVPYLIKKLAHPAVVKCIGFLALPQAFDNTVPAGLDEKVGIRRRAFAAMRELRRFAREINYKIGYPMFYTSKEKSKGDDVLYGRLNNTLFNFLYYFDAQLHRSIINPNGVRESIPINLENGIAPLIAEAMLVWIDGVAEVVIDSHTANITSKRSDRITSGNLDANAATAGAIGAYALQLPIYHIVEGWSHKLARETLRVFLGIHPERGEDENAKIAKNLYDNRKGDTQSPSGASAALEEWKKGQVGGVALGTLSLDHLETGTSIQSGEAAGEKRIREVKARQIEVWKNLFEPRSGGTDQFESLSGWTDQEDRIMTEFLYPEDIRLPGSSFLNKKVRKAAVLPPVGDQKKNPKIAADLTRMAVEDFLNYHLGEPDYKTQARGGSDRSPEGDYPQILRRGSEDHIQQFQDALTSWTAEILNGVTDEEKTDQETHQTARKFRAAKIGYLSALIKQLSENLNSTALFLKGLEASRLGEVLSLRESHESNDIEDQMEKKISKQKNYFQHQQDVLDKERDYIAAREARWSAEMMFSFTQRANVNLREWVKILAEELYKSVWTGQEQVRSNRIKLEELGAVREFLNIQDVEEDRYQNYIIDEQDGHQKVDEILNDLRWSILIEEKYDSKQDQKIPELTFNLKLMDQEFHTNKFEFNSELFLNRVREVFKNAWERETLLGWLWYLNDKNIQGWTIDELAERLVDKGQPALRQNEGVKPYKVGYIRMKEDVVQERNQYVNDLEHKLKDLSGIDKQTSQVLASSDPYRLSFLFFDELIDVDKITAYAEGRDGTGGVGGYTSLPAKTGAGGGTSRQVLHVFPAEHNAAVFEAQMGELLPDKIVMLLENISQFRRFMFSWAYGEVFMSEKLLIHDHHFDEDGTWIFRLATGPFEEDIDPITQTMPSEPEYRWLTDKSQIQPPLIRAAETMLIGGVDKWQIEGYELNINDDRIQKEINRQRQRLLERENIGEKNPVLKQTIENMQGNSESERKRKRNASLHLAEFEHLQSLNVRLENMLLPELEQKIENLDQGNRDAETYQQDRSDYVLDTYLMRLMQRVISEELISLKKMIIGK